MQSTTYPPTGRDVRFVLWNSGTFPVPDLNDGSKQKIARVTLLFTTPFEKPSPGTVSTTLKTPFGNLNGIDFVGAVHDLHAVLGNHLGLRSGEAALFAFKIESQKSGGFSRARVLRLEEIKTPPELRAFGSAAIKIRICGFQEAPGRGAGVTGAGLASGIDTLSLLKERGLCVRGIAPSTSKWSCSPATQRQHMRFVRLVSPVRFQRPIRTRERFQRTLERARVSADSPEHAPSNPLCPDTRLHPLSNTSLQILKYSELKTLVCRTRCTNSFCSDSSSSVYSSACAKKGERIWGRRRSARGPLAPSKESERLCALRSARREFSKRRRGLSAEKRA